MRLLNEIYVWLLQHPVALILLALYIGSLSYALYEAKNTPITEDDDDENE